MDKLQVLQKLASDEGLSAKIFKAIADPPTTSLQRLKGLTTGGLPTFIDVGNSFGAPAITEDNLIHQLVKNGKRVLMMGDDTWLQLFPDHFGISYPFPSFNVKDLDTVDNGCIDHLIPSLYQEDWDVLIAHFLGVDHAGHIFGVDSTPMMQKLDQYNAILEKVTEVLQDQSGPGGLHENTFLLVMGDHGQTLNGDHGGGTAEEVETSLFAMSLSKPPTSISSELDTASCTFDVDGKKICISTIQQLDFAVTMAALLGIPFPFGSIGRVNPELYALSAGTWNGRGTTATHGKCWSSLEVWMQSYVDVLCVNSWQVKKYIDLYSASSVIGFPKEDLLHVADIYAQAQANWPNRLKNLSLFESEFSNESCDSSLSVLLGQINDYSNFLARVAELARSKWTEFDLKLMVLGLGILLVSLFVHLWSIRSVNKLFMVYDASIGNPGISLRFMSALFMVAIRASSFLSNSYILEEGKVANFLLATTGILNLRYSITRRKIAIEAIAFLVLNFILGFSGVRGISKQDVGSSFMNIYPLRMLGINESHFYGMIETVPMLGLILLAFLLYRSTVGNSYWRYLKYFFVTGTILSYILIVVHWFLESKFLPTPMMLEGFGRNIAPRTIYAIGSGLVVLLAFSQACEQNGRISDYIKRVLIATVAMVSAWSSTVLLLLGRQGPLVALMSIVGGWCIIRLQKVAQDTAEGTLGVSVTDSISVTQWSLLSTCLFFYTGHWCNFDGLRYGAAFIGFDDFNLMRQGALLAIDTFGVSHILPILSLPFLVSFQYPYSLISKGNRVFFSNLKKVFLIYGLITAVTTTFTIVCVTIQRRHLMVWGLFAPKYVFDVVGLLLTDVLICLASLYYF
ncbi:alkaline-phosphatase-like family protein isoform X2 [Tasmannia lanceolata]